MKRGQVIALLAGTALGLTGVTIAVVVSRKESRQAAKRFFERYSTVAEQARKAGERAARVAVEQYHSNAPKAAEAISNVISHAPQAAEAITAKLPRISLNGKTEPAEVVS